MSVQSQSRPNVLFLFADQFNADCLSFMGHPMVKTPNLDALALRGASFNNMYACSAICGPSRTSFFTGTYVRTHGQFMNDGDLPRAWPSLLTETGKAGYMRVQTGKNHLPHAIAKDFDVMWSSVSHQRLLKAKGDVFKPSATFNQHFHSAVWPFPEASHRGVWTAQKTIDFLDSSVSKERPFFAWTSFAPPHSPHTPPESLDDLYDPDAVPIDWDLYRRFENSRMMNRPRVEDFWKVGCVRHDVRIFQKAVCRYLALITLVDREIGRILTALQDNGLADDTLVVFTADHGDFAGQYGQLGKNVPAYDPLIRIPFIYYDPAEPMHGRVVEGMYQNIDLMPTLLERLGLQTPPTCQGVSLLPAMKGCAGSSRDAVFSETSMEKTVRTRDWKMTFFVRHPGKGQLFKMTPEVNEIDNFWSDPAYASVKAELMERLMTWMATCEQPNNMDAWWEDYIDTPWYRWLNTQEKATAFPDPAYTNEAADD